MPTKIFKKSGISFVFAQRNAAHCISGQNNMVRGGGDSACTPRNEPNARNWLGELPPRTRQVMGEIVALGVLATLEARMRFEREKIMYITRGSVVFTMLPA